MRSLAAAGWLLACAALAGAAAPAGDDLPPTLFAAAPDARARTSNGSEPVPSLTRRAHVHQADQPTDALGGLLGHATGEGGGLAALLSASERAEEAGGEGAQAEAVKQQVEATPTPPPPSLVGDLPPTETVAPEVVTDLVWTAEEVTGAAPEEMPAAEVEVTEAEPEPAPAPAPAPSQAAAEEKEVVTPLLLPPSDGEDDPQEVADAAVDRLAGVGVIAPDLLQRFRAALGNGGGVEEEESGVLVPRLASLLRGGNGEGAEDPTSFLGGLLGGGKAAADAPAEDAAPTNGTNAADASAPVPPAPTGGESALALHNAARSRHVDTPPLTWSPAIAASASAHAARCVFSHSASSYGENIAMGQRSWAEVLEAWYEKEGPRGGHRTQVIWASSRELGCGAAACGKGLGRGGTLYVCQYSPAENVVGQARANVKPLKAGGGK